MTSRRTAHPTRIAGTVLVGVGAALALAGCGGPDGVEGQVVSTTRGKARPVTGDWVAVLDEGAARQWWVDTAMDPPSPAELPYLDNPVRHDDVRAVGGLLVSVDDNGRFHLDVSGERVVCRVVAAPSQADRLGGCARLDLPTSGTLTLQVTRDGLRSKVERD